jgi:hypothetical protein
MGRAVHMGGERGWVNWQKLTDFRTFSAIFTFFRSWNTSQTVLNKYSQKITFSKKSKNSIYGKCFNLMFSESTLLPCFIDVDENRQ